jgi:hypothetical protein
VRRNTRWTHWHYELQRKKAWLTLRWFNLLDLWDRIVLVALFLIGPSRQLRLPLPRRDCIWIPGKSLKAIADNLTKDQRFFASKVEA